MSQEGITMNRRIIKAIKATILITLSTNILIAGAMYARMIEGIVATAMLLISNGVIVTSGVYVSAQEIKRQREMEE